MQAKFLTTAVTGSNVFNDIGDRCLASVRFLCGEERSFHVIKDQQGLVVDAIVDTVALRTDDFAQACFTFILGVTVVPLFVGLAFKMIAFLSGSYRDYAALSQMQPGAYLEINRLSLLPEQSEIDLEDPALISVDQLSAQLLSFCDELNLDDPQTTKDALSQWVQRLSDPNTYVGANDPQKCRDEAIQYLQLIVNKLNESDPAVKLNVLIHVTGLLRRDRFEWGKSLSQIYFKFFDYDLKRALTEHVQAFKGEILRRYAQSHMLNVHQFFKMSEIWEKTFGLKESPPHQLPGVNIHIDDAVLSGFKDSCYNNYRMTFLVHFIQDNIGTYGTQEAREILSQLIERLNPQIADDILEQHVDTYFEKVPLEAAPDQPPLPFLNPKGIKALLVEFEIATNVP